jgi:hypothetical protein
VELLQSGLSWARLRMVLSLLLVVPVLCLTIGPPLARLLPITNLLGSFLNASLLSSGHWSFLLWIGGGLWIFFRKEKRLLGGVWALGGLVGLGSPFSPAGNGVLIISANVQAFSADVDDLEARLSEEMADVVLTIERRAEQLSGMVRVGDNFSRNLPKPSHGMAFFCREGLVCDAWVSEAIGEGSCSMPIALLRLSQQVCVMGIHVPPPVPGCSEAVRPYIFWMTDRIEAGRMGRDEGPCKKGDPVLAVGDFNAPPASWATRQMLDRGLHDAQAGRGIYASTWPAGGGWPNFPVFRLDHVFAGDLSVTGVQQFGLPQTDHQALRVWVEMD